MLVPEPLTKPECRPKSGYPFKVIEIKPKSLIIAELDGTHTEVELTNTPDALMQHYYDSLDSLWIALSMDGSYFIFNKLPIKGKWKSKL